MTDGPELSLEGGSWITRALCDEGATRVLIVEADEVADSLRQAHGLTGDATVLAAEAAIATLLLSAYVKGEEKLTLQIALEQPQARYIGEIDPDHRFRGRLSPSALPEGTDVHDLSGLMFAAKHDGTKEVYRGITALENTSVPGALRRHLVESTQLLGVLVTGVELDPQGHVVLAAGVLIERLPSHDVHKTLSESSFRERYAGFEQRTARQVLSDVQAREIDGQVLTILDHRPIFWGCTCSLDKVLHTLSGLGSVELREMAEEDGGAAIDCHFCNAHYDLTEQELIDLAIDVEARVASGDAPAEA